MKSGTNRETGELMTGIPYLRQRLADVINTPLGSVVGRRDFGSRVYQMLDRNVNKSFHMDAYVRLAEAINDPANGLDDFKLQSMQLTRVTQNHIEIALTGVFLVDGSPVTLDGIVLDG